MKGVLAKTGGNRKTVEYLLELGSNVNVTDATGPTPLMEAALWGHLKIVELLLEVGTDRESFRNLEKISLSAEQVVD